MEQREIAIETSRKISLMGLLCSFLVVCNHTSVAAPQGSLDWWISETIFNNGYCRIAVPFFFTVSGFLFVGRGGGWLRKKIKTLCIPYEIWGLAEWAFVLMMFAAAEALGVETHMERPGSMACVQTCINVCGCNLFTHSGSAPLWYIRNLLFLMLLVPLWERVLVNKISAHCVIVGWGMLLMLLEGVLRQEDKLGFFFLYTFSLQGVFFLIGMYLRQHPILLSSGYAKWLFVGGMLAFLLRSIMCLNHISEVLAGSIRWIGIVLMLTATWILMPAVQVGNFLSRLAFPIYCTHMIFLKFFAGICGLLGIRDLVLSSVFLSMMKTIVVILSISLFCRYIFCMSPRFGKLLFGGR